MKQYEIKTVPDAQVSFDDIAKAPIDVYPWGGDYRPVAYAQVVLIAGQGFLFRLSAEEQQPRAVYETYYDPVYRDSCLECFLDFCPGGGHYLNIEMNANGVSLTQFGTDRSDRADAAALLGEMFPVVAAQDASGWSVSVFVPLTSVARLFGMDTACFTPGYRFRGNFSKCGDDTGAPHYGLWNPVTSPGPDFHRPECFGELVIV